MGVKKFRSAEAARRHRENEASWEELKNRWAPKMIGPGPKQAKTLQMSPATRRLAEEEARRGPLKGKSLHTTGAIVDLSATKQEYDGIMLLREQRAQEETKKLQGRVSTLGSKMGLQYLTDSDVAEFKSGGLRRRS